MKALLVPAEIFDDFHLSALDVGHEPAQPQPAGRVRLIPMLASDYTHRLMAAREYLREASHRHPEWIVRRQA